MIAHQTDSHDGPLFLSSPYEAYRALRRHRGKAAWFFFGTMLLVTAGAIFLPRQYFSEAKVFVRLGRESVTLDPTATTGQTVAVDTTREAEITSVLDVLESRAVLEQVVDGLGPAVILDRPAPTPLDRERAIRALEGDMWTVNKKHSSVLTVGCKARTPELAQTIVQKLVDAFLERHLRAHRTHGSQEFFREQAGLLKVELDEAQRGLRDAKNEIGLIAIPEQRASLQQQMSAVEAATITSETDLASVQASAKALRETLSGLPERLLSQEVSGFFMDANDKAREELYKLQVREQELRTRYTAEHPLVMAVREQIAEARKILETQAASNVQATSASNPTWLALELARLNDEAQAAALEAKIASLRTEGDRLQQKLYALNNHQGTIEQWERRVELLQANHRAYSEKLEQARIDHALETERISNINIVQPATFVAKPAWPSLRLIFGLGFVVATLGGGGLALVCEYVETVRNNQGSKPHFRGDIRSRELVAEGVSHGL
jgi:uncharacterized protein involved in exopolysaccharide biosynthesis